MSFAPGLHVGKYELVRKLGEGGFGLVFVGRDAALEREVALKFLHAEHTANPEILRRFIQEARAAAKINHPGIVTVFECGQVTGTGTTNDGVAFIAMELLVGESLSDRLARAGRLTPEVACELVRQIASALDAAHAAGIIHRDLKPDNIYLCRDPAMPSGERVKVLDFGIAKLAQPDGSAGQTRTHVVMGTPTYMSPEQCRSAAQIDPRSDIYTLGCILFELVTGRPPFDGQLGELIAKHQLTPAPSARAVAPELSPALDGLLAAMLAKDAGERPQTMAVVERALTDPGMALGGAGAPAQLPPRTDRPVTTLGGAAGAVTAPPAAPAARGRGVLASGVGLALAAAGVAAFVGLRGDGADVRAPQAAAAPAPPPAADVTPPAPAPAPTAAPAPAAPVMITQRIEATPAAEVWTFDGRLLGTTPYEAQRVPAEGKVVYLLRAPGFADQRVELPANQSVTHTATRVATAKPAKKLERPRPAPTPLKPGDIVVD